MKRRPETFCLGSRPLETSSATSLRRMPGAQFFRQKIQKHLRFGRQQAGGGDGVHRHRPGFPRRQHGVQQAIGHMGMHHHMRQNGDAQAGGGEKGYTDYPALNA